jgi:hypothetical protein
MQHIFNFSIDSVYYFLKKVWLTDLRKFLKNQNLVERPKS